MIGDFAAMTSSSSSPHVRACLMTLKKFGAVYNASCAGKFKDSTPTDVISEAWPRMLATRMPARPGSTEDHAD
eukprot:11151718-Heterocapsa_arctica.AAC.1